MWKLIFILTCMPGIILGSDSWIGKAEGGFSVKVVISSTTLPVDEKLDITIRLHYPDTHTVDLDKIRTNLLKYVGLSEPPFALTSEKVEALQDGGLKVSFQLEPLLDGIHFLSFYDIVFPPNNPKTNTTAVIISEIFKIETSLPSIDKNFRSLAYPLLSLTKRFPITLSQENRKNLLNNPQLQAIEADRNEAIFKQKTLPWPELSGAFLFLFILLIARMQPKRKPDLKKEMRKRALTAKRKAINALTTLEEEKLPQKNEFEQFYMSLTDTVRKYIEENYQEPATTKTTEIFLKMMAASPKFDDETKNLLKDFLNSSDRVKFAKHEPTLEECLEAQQMAKQFIERES